MEGRRLSWRDWHAYTVTALQMITCTLLFSIIGARWTAPEQTNITGWVLCPGLMLLAMLPAIAHFRICSWISLFYCLLFSFFSIIFWVFLPACILHYILYCISTWLWSIWVVFDLMFFVTCSVTHSSLTVTSSVIRSSAGMKVLHLMSLNTSVIVSCVQ